MMMLFRREGLLPEARTRQVLQEPERGDIEAVGADLEGTHGMTAAEVSTDAVAPPLSMHADAITIRFGGLIAVNNVSFTIPNGSIVSLIGPNGAGKTTFFNVLTGLYKPTSAGCVLGERDVTGLAPHKIASSAWPGPSRTSGCSA